MQLINSENSPFFHCFNQFFTDYNFHTGRIRHQQPLALYQRRHGFFLLASSHRLASGTYGYLYFRCTPPVSGEAVDAGTVGLVSILSFRSVENETVVPSLVQIIVP